MPVRPSMWPSKHPTEMGKYIHSRFRVTREHRIGCKLPVIWFLTNSRVRYCGFDSAPWTSRAQVHAVRIRNQVVAVKTKQNKKKVYVSFFLLFTLCIMCPVTADKSVILRTCVCFIYWNTALWTWQGFKIASGLKRAQPDGAGIPLGWKALLSQWLCICW